MSTRGVIARTTGVEGGFRGVYNHSDSYPKWLGAHLWTILHRKFQGDLSAMLRFLIDEHAAGWSQAGIECFCHPKRDRKPESEEHWFTNEDMVDDTDIEWIYAFDEESNRLYIRDQKAKEDVGIVDLAGPEPDWKLMECGQNFERCGHYAWVHFPNMMDSNLGTKTYLGRRAFEMHDAIAFIIDGKRYASTRSGGNSDYFNGSFRRVGVHMRYPSNCWIATVKLRNGHHKNVPVARIVDGKYIPYPGVTWVYPPTKDNPDETLFS